MRIQSIEIENITSLRGKHQIDLAESLQGEELFAITGPTGSGKSSLLSAISLALYGRTYKGSLSANDFVTTGEAYAMASLKFILAGKNYQANWSIKTLKKNGDPIKNPKPARELICEGEALENANASEILGLDFDQFCKTIILNQGQFAEFLHSSFKERKDIIEKLYRTGELSELGKILKEKVKKEEHELELCQAHFEKALPYSEEEIKLIKTELEENQVLLGIHEELTKLFNPAYTDLNHLYQKLKEETDYQEKVSLSQKKLEQFTNNWNESKNQLLDLKKTYERSKANSEKEGPKLREAISHQTNLDHSLKSLSAVKHGLEGAKTNIAKTKESISLKSKQLEALILELKKLKETYTNKALFLNKTTNEVYSFKEDLNKLKQYSLDIQKNRTEFELHSTSNQKITKELELKNKSLIDQNPEKLDLSGDSSELLANLRRGRESILELWSNLERDASDLATLLTRDKELSLKKIGLSKEYDLKKIKLENLRLVLENQKLTRAMNECATEAKKTGECPVCKSSDLSKLIEQVDQKEISTDEQSLLEEEVSKLNFQREADIKQEEDLKALIDEKRERINKLSKNLFSDLAKPIKWQDSSEVEQGLKILKELNHNNLSKNLEKQESLQLLFSLQKEIKLTEQSLKKGLEEAKLLDKDLEKTNQLVQLFMNNWKEIIPDLKPPAEILLEFEKDLEVFNKFIQANQRLESLTESLETDKKRHQELTDKESSDQESKVELEANIEKLKSKLKIICDGKNPIELLESLEKTERSSLSEFQKKNTDYLKVEKLKTNEEQSLRIYLEQISDLQNLQKTYLKKLKLIFKDLGSYADKIPENYPLFDSCQDVFKASSKWIFFEEGASSKDLLLIIESRIESTWKVLNEKISDVSLELKTSVQTNKKQIIEYNQKLEGRSELEASLKKLKKSLGLKERLLEVFGKDEFRSYALGLLEEELVAGANNELDELCDGRYQLKLQPGRGGQMEFFVCDNWRESILRKIDTLSGGETFLASLAMALALAELTRGQNEIDSFFIDEGFGHLDEGSIEEVLEVLMNIQNRGKQIGIISHVKALTDRIPVNLTLQKTSLGESTTEFIYN